MKTFSTIFSVLSNLAVLLCVYHSTTVQYSTVQYSTVQYSTVHYHWPPHWPGGERRAQREWRGWWAWQDRRDWRDVTPTQPLILSLISSEARQGIISNQVTFGTEISGGGGGRQIMFFVPCCKLNVKSEKILSNFDFWPSSSVNEWAPPW